MSRRLQEIRDRFKNSDGSSTTAIFNLERSSFRNCSCIATMGYRYFQLLHNSHEIGQRRGFHFLHDLTAVNLKRYCADPEFRGCLLVEQATSNQRQNFAFTRGEAAKALLKLGQIRPFRAEYAILTYRRADCLYQRRLAERLWQKI